MKHLTIIAALLLLIACNKEGSDFQEGDYCPLDGNYYDYNPEIGMDLGEEIITSFSGRIIDKNHQPLVNAKVKIGRLNTWTDEEGNFIFEEAKTNMNYGLITAEKDGFFKGYRNMTPRVGVQNRVEIMLLEKTLMGSINSERGGVVNVEGGHSITFESGFTTELRHQDDAGIPYQGKVSVFATYIDPTSKDIGFMIPGSLVGMNDENREVLLISYGMLNVELYGESGQKLQLAAGSRAEIKVKVPEVLMKAAPKNLPLWYLDDRKGYWVEYGESSLIDGFYVGKVGHFTPTNVDGVFDN